MGVLKSFPQEPQRRPALPVGLRTTTWDLSRESLDRLLRFLDRDRDRAARKYEKIRLKLVRLFEWRGCAYADDLADVVIDRVAAKLEDGVRIKAEDPYRYFAKTAHFVFKEVLDGEIKERRVLQAAARFAPPPVEEDEAREDEAALQCLDHCLQKLSPRSRETMLRYHQGEGGKRIANRKRIAAELSLSMNTLRIRMHRIRATLEACVSRCMTGSQDSRGRG